MKDCYIECCNTHDFASVNNLLYTLYLVVCVRYFKRIDFDNDELQIAYKDILDDFIEYIKQRDNKELDGISNHIHSTDMDSITVEYVENKYKKVTNDDMVGGNPYLSAVDYVLSLVVDFISGHNTN